MNDKYSTTEGKTSEKLSDEAMLSAQWKSIDWHKAEREVNRLQIRIVKATQQKDYNAVKRLQYLLTHSFYAKALAVKRAVTNDGRRTPGVDGVLWNTPAKKMAAALSLTDKGYRARPLRRVYIEKKDKKKKRPLGIKPSKKAVKAIVSNISDTILRRGKAWQQDVLIMKLNKQIRGWTNYHQSVCASDAFAHLDYVLYELLWRWAKRRHPKKNKWWISTRYWHRVGNRNWVFSTENKELIRVDSTAIVRHTKIKATANPFLDEAYFQKRKFDKGMHRLTGKFKMIWKNQNGLCYHCGMPMDVTEEREIFYLAPKAKAGMEDVRNMRYVHCTCQRIYAENRLKK